MFDSVQPSPDNAVVTADALHCQKKTARTIVKRGGDYLISLADNQPKLREQARRRLEAEGCGFPHAAQVIVEERRYLGKKTGKPRIFIRHFITSLLPGEVTGQRLAGLIRHHWSVENRNHWRRDASRWKEDACRQSKPSPPRTSLCCHTCR